MSAIDRDKAIEALEAFHDVLPTSQERDTAFSALNIIRAQDVISDAPPLDGAPVGQVLTREMLDEVIGSIVSPDMPTSDVQFWAMGELRDALLAKFGAAPQVRECPTNHFAPDGKAWDEGSRNVSGTSDYFTCAFCPDCGADLETEVKA